MKSNFIDRINLIMGEKDITQSELARITGITQSTISDWVRGKYLPRQDKVDILANALKVSPSYLMGWDENPAELEVIGKIETSHNYPYVDDPVSAGVPSTIEGVMKLNTYPIADNLLGKYAGNPNILLMRVGGRSMDKIIPDGSLIAVVRDFPIQNLKDGDIVVFNHEYEFGLKHYFDKGEYLMFSPNSTDKRFDDMIFRKNEEINIVGKVVMYSVVLD